MSRAAQRERILIGAYVDAIPLVTTPVRQLNERIWELYRKPEPLTEAEWAEWERLVG